MKYKVLSQFLKTGAKFDANAKKAVKSGVDHYNSRSLIAKNPKQILDYSFSPDGTTLELILESEEKLPMPSKALRLFSTYLVQETCIGSEDYLVGKQLFKMTASDYEEPAFAIEADPVNNEMARMERFARYMTLLQKADSSMKADLDKIDKEIEKLINKTK